MRISHLETLLADLLRDLGLEVSQQVEFLDTRLDGAGKFYVDMVVEHSLVVEVDDAANHRRPSFRRRDALKDEFIKASGKSVLRFSDREVLYDIDRIASVILRTARRL